MPFLEKHKTADPSPGCRGCPRLGSFLREWRGKEPGWHNRPTMTWTPESGDDSVRLLIVGLAPGLRGANRTGRAFTGDASGDVLCDALARHGLASGTFGNEPDDGFALVGTAITNAVRCVPPENKPLPQEINTCRDRYLPHTIRRFANLKAILTIGRIAHDASARALKQKPRTVPFGHGARFQLLREGAGDVALIASYHCSRYNMNTGVMTLEMLDAVIREAKTAAQL